MTEHEADITAPRSHLTAALATAQSEMPNASLNRVNPHFKSKYADLAAIRAATLPSLNKYGMSLTQFTKIRDGEFILITRLQHTTGEFLESEYPLPTQLDKPQVMGSALTYARRYSWASMCGVFAEDDDDANAATGNKKAGKTSGSNQNFGGPRGKTLLKAEMRAFAGDLAACEETDTLAGLMNASQGMLDQCMRDLPDWYYGQDNVVDGKTIHESGALDRINDKRGELQEREAPAIQ
jgi:hypothetical protein